MNQITRQIKEILSVVLECDLSQQSDEADLILLGLDSIHFIQMIIALEDALNKRIPDEYLQIDAMNTGKKIEKAFENVQS